VCTPCPHGKQKGSCVVCTPCPHGKLKQYCVVCTPCPHGKLKYSCAECTPCPHGKVKNSCVECNPCPHGKLKRKCVNCTPCPHGKRKDHCAECTLNKIEGTLGLVELMKKKETEKFADPKPHMYFPPRGTPVVDQSVLNPKLTEFEVEYYKALKVMLLDKDGEIKNPAIPMWELGKHTCEVYNGPCMVCLGLFGCIK
jgi:hypothetical protein